MPPRKEKEAVVLLLDVGMHTASKDEKGKSFLDSSKECLSMIVQRKLFSNSADELGLIVFGCDDSNNPLSDDGYRNISVVKNLSLATWDLLKFIDKVRVYEDTTADWLDGIIVAMQFLRDEVGAKDFVNTKIVIFSNFLGDVNDDQVEIVINGINEMKVNLIVIGPEFDNDVVSDEKTKYKGGRLILQIIEQVGGVICSFQDAIPELMYFQRKSVRPTPWNANFRVSRDIIIPISAYKKVAEITQFKWFNESVDDKSAELTREKAYVKLQEENVEKEVKKEDVIEGYEFGSTIIPFSTTEKVAMNYQSGEKGLSLIGVTKRDNVPLHILVGQGSYILTARSGDEDANIALQAFTLSLYNVDKVGIARKVYRDNSSVTINALFPVVSDDANYIVMNELPFAEEEHVYKFPSLCSRFTTTEEQKSAIYELIDSMDLDETEDHGEIYDPLRTYDPHDQYTLHTMTYKALHPHEDIPGDVSNVVQHMLKPLPNLVEDSKEPLEKIKKLFPLKENVKKEKTRKRVSKGWGGYITGNTSATDSAVLVHDNKIDLSEEFKKIQQGKSSDEVCKEMEKSVEQLLYGQDTLKPCAVMKMLRKYSIECNNANNYNEWLMRLKTTVEQCNYIDFWNKVIQDELGFISKTESADSEVSSEEALEFQKLKENNTYAMDSNTIDELLNEF